MAKSEEQARPPGGTIRVPGPSKGSRTPRKVQWPDEEVDMSPTRSAHMLDEHGLDVSESSSRCAGGSKIHWSVAA